MHEYPVIQINGRPAPWNSVSALVRDRAAQHGDRVFAEIDGRTLTYRGFDDGANRVAAGLARLGLAPGVCVASLMHNCVEQVLGWVGANRAGCLWAPLNAALVGDDLARTLRDTGASVFIVDAENLPKLTALPQDLRASLRIYVVDDPAEHPFDALLADGPAPVPSPLPGDPAMILYTGGTTGLPKGVVLPHFAVVASGYRYGECLSPTATDRHYTTLPLFHASGIELGIVGPLVSDMTVVMDRRFSASSYWQRVIETGATIIDPVSTMMSVLVLQPESPLDRAHRVRITTGVNGQVPPAVPEEFTRRFGIPIIDIYGQSETGGAAATSNRLPGARPGSVGHPHGWSEVAIVDDNDCPLPHGTTGQIVLRPTVPFTFMLGYHNNPAETQRVWRNLWFHSGDFGHLDADGYLYFAGRKAHWLRRRGENISAYEVEAVLAAHPNVEEVIVTGVPSELGDEDVKAWIIASGEKPAEADLIVWCTSRLAAFKMPRYIAFVRDFPRSATKRDVERAKVKAWTDQDHWDRERQPGGRLFGKP